MKGEGLRAVGLGLKGEGGDMAGNKDVVGDIIVLRERVAYESDSPSRGGRGIIVIVDSMAGGVGGEGPIIFAI